MFRSTSARLKAKELISPSSGPISCPPLWWSMKGGSMKIIGRDLARKRMVIASDPTHPVAKLTIERTEIAYDKFKLSWRVGHADGDTSGNVIVWKNELISAFGYRGREGDSIDVISPSGGAMAEQVQRPASAADQGLYFRLGPYLNIPCPG